MIGGASISSALAASPLWQLPPEQAPLVFVDLEMTGLDAARDRVCEVGLLRYAGRREEASFESLANPGVDPGASAEIHKLDGALLAQAPPFEALCGRVLELLDGAFLVAHGADSDVAFLQAELGRLGHPLPVVGVIDTLPLARRCFLSRSHGLGALSAALGLDHARHHRAGDDARATAQLFWRVVDALSPSSMADLHSVRVGERQARPSILAAVSEAIAGRKPVLVRHRTPRRPTEEMWMVLTSVRTDVDPPRVMGYLHPGRGRRELRADRILAIVPAAHPETP